MVGREDPRSKIEHGKALPGNVTLEWAVNVRCGSEHDPVGSAGNSSDATRQNTTNTFSKQRAVCDMSPSLQQLHRPLAVHHVKPRFFARLFSTRLIVSPSVATATFIGCVHRRLAASRPAMPPAHASSYAPAQSHSLCPVCYRVEPAATRALVGQPQRSSARTWRINCLYNCGHVPLSCERD